MIHILLIVYEVSLYFSLLFLVLKLDYLGFLKLFLMYLYLAYLLFV